MGSGGSKAKASSGPKTDILKETDEDPMNLDDFVEGYPPPKPVLDKKRHIFTTEDKAVADSRASQIRVEDYQSFEALSRALTEGLWKDVQKVRALFTWIGLQGSKGHNSKNNVEPLSPQHIVQLVTQRKASYNLLFVSLCRAVKIPCVFIRGFAKSAAYEVGDRTVDKLGNSWTAVFVSGGWRLVFPLWAFSAIVGHSTGTWTLVESDGKGARETAEKSSGTTVSNFNDYYFLTDPEEFIYFCLPRDPEWQLLAKPFTKQKFIEIANCEQAYFENHIQITTKLECLYTSENGVCDIGIKKTNGEEFKHLYKLYFNHEKSNTKLSKEIQLDRYVAVMNNKSAVNFRIRFPGAGIYKMELYGGSPTGFPLICSFRLDCNEDVSNVKPFPCNPEAGFGPNLVTTSAGLEAESHKSGFINIKKSKNVNIKFNLSKNVTVQTVLVHNNIKEEVLSQHVTHKVKGKELDINVNVPQQGEYALQINTKTKGSSEPFKNTCNYLLASEDMNKKKRSYENAAEKKARNNLNECLKSNDPESIQKALDKFDQFDLDDNGKREKAERKKNFLVLQKELKEAIARRNVDILETALDNAKSSEFSSNLQNQIKEGEQLLAELRKIKRFAHEVLQMKQSTISEIHTYKHPKPLAYDIMKATYVLLGEKESHLEEWEQIQGLMRKTGKQGLLRRVREFDTIHVTENMVNNAAQLLRPYDKETAATASAGLGTFYKWNPIPHTLPEYHVPKPPHNRTLELLQFFDFDAVDAEAKTVLPDDYKTIKELAERLTVAYPKALLKVRALFVWMSAQPIFSRKWSPKAAADSPEGILGMMKRGETSYTTLFAMLCRAVDIQCVTIQGIAKSVAYEVGDKKTENLTNSWNAVYVGGSWRIIFPLWACRCVVGHSTGKWTLIESTGAGKRQESKVSGGTVINQLNEFYFLTDPDVFLYHCFPNEPKWQLIPKVISKERFLDLPYLRQDFFKNKLKLLSTYSCRLESLQGECDVAIKIPEDLSITLSYDLFFNSKESGSTLPSNIQLQNYVAMVHQDCKVTFVMRFPVQGIYKLRINGVVNGMNQWLLSSRITCTDVKEQTNPYPSVPEIGFGPQKLTQDAGLQPISHKSGLVQVHRNRACGIEFALTKFVTVQTTLYSFVISSDSLAKYVTQHVQNDNLRIYVTPPEEGEYTLHINCKEKGSTGGFKNVCNYLLNTDIKRMRTWENAREKVARLDLRTKTFSATSKNAEELQHAIEKADTLCLLDKGDIKVAHERLDFLQLQKGLLDGINRRNIDVLIPAINAAKSSEHEYKLMDRIKEAEELREHLLTLKRFAHDVLEMRQTTISELHRYAIPPPLVFSIMKATYLLLGEPSRNLQIWEDIQTLMRQTGRQSLLYRVRKFDTLGTDKELATEVLEILEPYTAEQVSTASAGAGTFYNWAKNIATQIIGNKKSKSTVSKASNKSGAGKPQKVKK
ncbi:uncharacterized protein LOC134259203 [Saccostrea cucullata]|uniref:uncharacterized protein LOC134259203 n=1 Tax=Saccostrea cuccullata TaxID=36930 RepID=UPI002ED07518